RTLRLGPHHRPVRARARPRGGGPRRPCRAAARPRAYRPRRARDIGVAGRALAVGPRPRPAALAATVQRRRAALGPRARAPLTPRHSSWPTSHHTSYGAMT